MFFLGYSGWDSQQLDCELEESSWIITENKHNQNILGLNCANLWREKIIELGGDYLIWSNTPENPNYN